MFRVTPLCLHGISHIVAQIRTSTGAALAHRATLALLTWIGIDDGACGDDAFSFHRLPCWVAYRQLLRRRAAARHRHPRLLWTEHWTWPRRRCDVVWRAASKSKIICHAGNDAHWLRTTRTDGRRAYRVGLRRRAQNEHQRQALGMYWHRCGACWQSKARVSCCVYAPFGAARCRPDATRQASESKNQHLAAGYARVLRLINISVKQATRIRRRSSTLRVACWARRRVSSS